MSMVDSFSGKTIGKYTLLEEIGSGGMASVYKAKQLNIDRMVAIKIMLSRYVESQDFVIRFQREADTIAQLEHPNIVPIYDYGHVEEEKLFYIVTRLMVGGSLAESITKDAPFPIPRVRQIVQQLGGALNYAHEKGVTHRDLKPGNVLLDNFDNVYLTDFGIARLDSAQSITESGVVVGTPAYIAPEQWRGYPADARADIYALGIMLFQMLAGFLPFSAESNSTLMYKHLEEDPPSLIEKMPHLTPAIEHVIHKAMAKDLDERFATADELIDAFEAAITPTERDMRTAVDIGDSQVQAPDIDTAATMVDTPAPVPTPPTTPPSTNAPPATPHPNTPPASTPPPITPYPTTPPMVTGQPGAYMDMRWLIGGGIVIVLALVVVIVLLVFDSRSNVPGVVVAPASDTPTVVPTETTAPTAAEAPTSTPAPTDTPETRPTATDIVVPTAVARVASEIHEPFDSTTMLNWDRLEGNRYIADGQYHTVTMEGQDGSGLVIAQGMPPIGDFRLEIEAEDLSKVDTQIVYAALFRVQDSSNFYRFTVTNDGQAGVIKHIDGQQMALPFTTIYNWNKSVKKHKLGIEMVGSEMVLYVDDQIVLRYVDDDIPEPGGVGLTVFRAGAHIAWDNLMIEPISRLSDSLTASTTSFREEFDGNACQWPDFANDEEIYLDGGGYHLEVADGMSGIQVSCATLGLYGDMRIETSVENLSEGTSSFGIVFRDSVSDDNYYRMIVNSVGQIELVKFLENDADCQPCQLDLQPIPGFKGDEPHTLTVEAFENTIRGFVDGQLMIEVEDDSILEPGMIRLGAYQDGARIVFDDLLIEPIDSLSVLSAGIEGSLPEVVQSILGDDVKAPLVFSEDQISVSISVDPASPAASTPIPIPDEMRDFIFSADVVYDTGSAGDHCGLVYRAVGPEQYRWINLTRNGTVAFGDQAHLPSDPIGLHRLNLQNIQRGQAAHLVVIAQGESIFLAINGNRIQLNDLVDDDPTSGGMLAWIYLSANNASDCIFENVSVWSLSEGLS